MQRRANLSDKTHKKQKIVTNQPEFQSESNQIHEEGNHARRCSPELTTYRSSTIKDRSQLTDQSWIKYFVKLRNKYFYKLRIRPKRRGNLRDKKRTKPALPPPRPPPPRPPLPPRSPP